MAGPVGPSTGWMRHMPTTHDTAAGDGLNGGAAAANGAAPNGSALGNGHGIAEPAPGLDPVELGYSSGSSSDLAAANERPNGTAAVHPDVAPRSASAAPAPGPHRQMGGSESKLDRFRDKARGQKDEARRQFEERRMRLKGSLLSRVGKGRDSEASGWFHGVLHVTIHEAVDLPGDPTMLSLCPSIVNGCLIGTSTMLHGKKPAPHPYVVVSIGGLKEAYTSVPAATDNPKWEERFRILVAGRVQDVHFAVKEWDNFGSPHLGVARIAGEEVANGVPIEKRWLRLKHRTGRPSNFGKARLLVSVDFDPVGPEGVGKRAEEYSWENKHAYFQPRRGNRVTLYADAHAVAEPLPPIPLAGGRQWNQASCWDDLFAAITAAKHFIYITGWSVWHEVMLVRDRNGPMVPTDERPQLGQLLIKKANEGVRVLILQWDDRTSVKGAYIFSCIKTTGLLDTHDEDTRAYFNGTGVQVKLALRGSDQEKNIIKENVGATNYTHHQKAVILDTADAGTERRRVTAFIGGIDVTTGRYDDAEHSLFRENHTTHSHDWMQHNVTGAVQECGGPREPWHDVHCRLEGPVAFDVLTNFEQRWQKQAKEYVKLLLDPQSVPGLILPGDPSGAGTHVVEEGDPEEWVTQIFRSIDTESCVGFPTTNAEAYDRGLISMPNGKIVDKSIQHAYIHAIRKAEHFLYFENQYWLGGSGEWQSLEMANICRHIVPVEIALKVSEKIMEGKHFAAYCVIPLFPEGAPESGTVQEVLHFQTQTIRMMYRIVAEALRQTRSKAHPRDYLNFFCPMKREVKHPGEPEPAKQPPKDSDQALVQTTRRNQIYVHAKTVMVDDEYIIVGSANINQRSQDGARDTELAMGSFQPALKNRGGVYGFRMSLWREHLGHLEPVFEQPGTLACVERVRELSKANWEAYVAEEVQELPHGHLVPYPVAVEPDGFVTTLPGHRNFPDTKGSILGAVMKVPKFVRNAFGNYVTT